MGAIASGGMVVLNDDVSAGFPFAPEAIQRVVEQEGRELVRREHAYREGRAAMRLDRQVTVFLVDDGLATGSSIRAAIVALRRAASRQDRRRRTGGARVDMPGAGDRGRRGDVRHDPVAVLCRRSVLLGLHPDHGRRGVRAPAGTSWRSPRRASPRPSSEVDTLRSELVASPEQWAGPRAGARIGGRCPARAVG